MDGRVVVYSAILLLLCCRVQAPWWKWPSVFLYFYFSVPVALKAILIARGQNSRGLHFERDLKTMHILEMV